LGLPVRNYCLGPTWAEIPYYSLLVEECDMPASRAAELAAAADAALRALNIEYETKRKSRRLGPICVKTIPAGAWQAFDVKTVAERGGRVEQYKHKFLVNKVDFEREFEIKGTYHPPCA
jgi:hypothetical protein